MWIASFTLFAQNITVSGTVIDTDNVPVIGATVVLQDDASHGSVTDIDGNYSISNVPVDASLQFSYVGMKTQLIPVNGRSVIHVVLESDSELLDEVIVVGYGTQRKVNLTGAVAQISDKELSNRPIQNVSTALQGLMSGLTVMSGQGRPGRARTRIPTRTGTTWPLGRECSTSITCLQAVEPIR